MTLETYLNTIQHKYLTANGNQGNPTKPLSKRNKLKAYHRRDKSWSQCSADKISACMQFSPFRVSSLQGFNSQYIHVPSVQALPWRLIFFLSLKFKFFLSPFHKICFSSVSIVLYTSTCPSKRKPVHLSTWISFHHQVLLSFHFYPHVFRWKQQLHPSPAWWSQWSKKTLSHAEARAKEKKGHSTNPKRWSKLQIT